MTHHEGEPLPEKTVHRDEVIRLADLFTVLDMIMDHQFENCLLVGPGIIFPQKCLFNGVVFEAVPKDIYWSLSPGQTAPIGTMMFYGCEFYDCHLLRIGVAGPAASRHQFIQDLGGALP